MIKMLRYKGGKNAHMAVRERVLAFLLASVRPRPSTYAPSVRGVFGRRGPELRGAVGSSQWCLRSAGHGGGSGLGVTVPGAGSSDRGR